MNTLARMTSLEFYNQKNSIATGHYEVVEHDGSVSYVIVTYSIEWMDESEYLAWHDRNEHAALWQANLNSFDIHYEDLDQDFYFYDDAIGSDEMFYQQ